MFYENWSKYFLRTENCAQKRNNMNFRVFSLQKKSVMLRKRAVVESVNDELKGICLIKPVLATSPLPTLLNMIAGLLTRSLLPRNRDSRRILSKTNNFFSKIISSSR